MAAGPGEAIRIALVEDHAATRDELVLAIRAFGERVTLVQAFASAEELLSASVVDTLDVALIDLGLPGMRGADAIRALAERAPACRALALTVFDDERSVLDAIDAGAYGYLLKTEPLVKLRYAIEDAHAGGHPISSRVAGFLFATKRARATDVALSARERELAVALADGLSYAESADRMGVTLSTVQEYVKRLYRKLDVNSRVEVRRWVARHRLDRSPG